MKSTWLLELADGQEQVEADEVEITASGALVFYRDAGRRESGRTLLSAWSATSWQRCLLQAGD
ncbi:MAG TPA: hypothetical protein VLC53_13460 [Myxococcota bacterium]|jgi:hypothetical protein|nr:hypothetical protein [Myxococcota bacterium]